MYQYYSYIQDERVKDMVFNVTFNNISVISWGVNFTSGGNLLQVTDKHCIYCIGVHLA